VAIQEVVAGRGGVDAVERLDSILEKNSISWGTSVSQPTSGKGTERYAFIWKNSKITMISQRLSQHLSYLVDREPYVLEMDISGIHKKYKLNLVVVSFHAVPKAKNPGHEIEALIREPVIVDRAKETIVLGDFNLSFEDPSFEVLRFLQFKPLIESKTALRRSLKNGSHLTHNYDNIWIRKAEIVCFLSFSGG
jgi:hypothetical protein